MQKEQIIAMGIINQGKILKLKVDIRVTILDGFKRDQTKIKAVTQVARYSQDL